MPFAFAKRRAFNFLAIFAGFLVVNLVSVEKKQCFSVLLK